MYYVEFLRVRRSLLIATIAIGGVLALNLILFKAGHVDIPARTFTIPLTIVWAFAGFVTSIFASVLGGSLACENDGHLAVAWTKPVSKTKHALIKMAVDLGAIAVLFGIMCAAVFAYFAVTGLSRHLVVPPDAWFQLIRFLIAPAAFYGLTQALTSGLGKQAGLVCGMTWVALFALLVLGTLPLPAPYHQLVDFINNANPVIYLAFNIDDNGAFISYGLAAATVALTAIALCGGAAAIYRWQHVEA